MTGSGRTQVLVGLDRPEETWLFLPVAALFTLCWLVFSWPWLSGSVTIPWDAKAQFAPQVQFLAASLARGESPFWAPFNFAGHPQIADPQSLMFSPPFVILALLNGAPGSHAIDVTVLLCMLAGGYGVLWLTRDLGWHWAGAMIAALGFCFGASMAWRLQHFGQVLSQCYLPFAFLFLKRGLQRNSVAYGAGAGIVGAFIVLGRDQVALLEIYILMGYAVWHVATAADRRGALLQSIKPLAAGAAAGIALIVIPLTMTLLLAEHSNRPAIDYPGAAAGSLHPGLLVTTIIPHLFGAAGEMENYWGPPSFTWVGTGLFIAQNMGQLYIGAIPILLLIAATTRGLLWNRDVRFFAVTLVFVTLYALGGYTPVFRIFYELMPGVKLFRRPADATFLMGGFASLLAGYAVHRFFTWSLPDGKPWQRTVEAGAIAAAFVFAAVVAVIYDRTTRAVEPALIAACCIAAGLAALFWADRMKALRPAAVAITLIALTTVDVAWNNGPSGASAIDPREVEILEPGQPQPDARADSSIAGTAELDRASRSSGADRPRLPLAQRFADPRHRADARLQSGAAEALCRRYRRWRQFRGLGPAQVLEVDAFIPVADRRSARLALHRLRRSDRENRSSFETG